MAYYSFSPDRHSVSTNQSSHTSLFPNTYKTTSDYRIERDSRITCELPISATTSLRTEHAHIVTNATKEELEHYGNVAYMRLKVENTILREEYDRLHETNKKTFETVQALAQNKSLDDSSILIKPSGDRILLQRSNYPEIKYWYKHEWMSYLKARSTLVRPMRTNKEEDCESLKFIVDEDGKAINGHQATFIRSTAKGIWLALLKANRAPTTWGQADIQAIDFYRTNMYTKFSYLKLCDNDWKVDWLAALDYPGWHRRYTEHETSVRTKRESDSSPPESLYPCKKPKLNLSSATTRGPTTDSLDTVLHRTVPNHKSLPGVTLANESEAQFDTPSNEPTFMDIPRSTTRAPIGSRNSEESTTNDLEILKQTHVKPQPIPSSIAIRPHVAPLQLASSSMPSTSASGSSSSSDPPTISYDQCEVPAQSNNRPSAPISPTAPISAPAPTFSSETATQPEIAKEIIPLQDPFAVRANQLPQASIHEMADNARPTRSRRLTSKALETTTDRTISNSNNEPLFKYNKTSATLMNLFGFDYLKQCSNGKATKAEVVQAFGVLSKEMLNEYQKKRDNLQATRKKK